MVGQNFAHALPSQGKWKQDVSRWLAEDVPSFDIGGFVVGDDQKSATLWCKESVCFLIDFKTNPASFFF